MNTAESIQKIKEEYYISNFSVNEIQRGWQIPHKLIPNIIPTLRVLQHLREEEDIPFFINSAYRDAAYNEAIGGKSGSLHLDFNAIDFTIKESNYAKKAWRLYQLYKKLDKWDTEGFFSFLGYGKMGLGRYNTFIHLDTRGTLGRKSPARW